MKERPFENIVGKGENAGNRHFLLSHNVFYPSQIKFQHLSNTYFVFCECFQDKSDFLIFLVKVYGLLPTKNKQCAGNRIAEK